MVTRQLTPGECVVEEPRPMPRLLFLCAAFPLLPKPIGPFAASQHQIVAIFNYINPKLMLRFFLLERRPVFTPPVPSDKSRSGHCAREPMERTLSFRSTLIRRKFHRIAGQSSK
jgi:hypothetical protein